MKKLFTIGYEGAHLSDFIETVRAAKIDVLLDVRQLPMSRRRGFSKSSLAAALTAVGISYRHERRLGSPKSIRDRVREDGNYKRFFRDFERHLAKQSDVLEDIGNTLNGNVALMCYEEDHTRCHRQSVAAALGARFGTAPIHLVVPPLTSHKTKT